MDESENTETRLDCCMKLFDIYSKISGILSDKQLFDEYQMKIKKYLGFAVNNAKDILMHSYKQLDKCLLNLCENMESENYDNMENQKEIAKAYVKLVHFIRSQNDENLQDDFILFVLKAMKLDSSEGRQLFPCVLMQNKLGSECKDIFIKEVNRYFLVTVYT